MEREFWFGTNGPIFASLEAAEADWLTDHDELPTVYFWREVQDGAVVREGSTAREAPYGTVVYS